MPASLADALDVLADAHAPMSLREKAIACLNRALHHLAGPDPGRQDAAQTVTARLWTGTIHRRPNRTEEEARAYLHRALLHAVVDGRPRRFAPAPREVEAEREPVSGRRLAADSAGERRLKEVLVTALDQLRRGDLPRALSSRRRPDHRRHLLRGLKLRGRQLTAALIGGPQPRLSLTDARASRRAAALLRTLYSPDDPDPLAACIGRLAAVDLRDLPGQPAAPTERNH